MPRTKKSTPVVPAPAIPPEPPDDAARLRALNDQARANAIRSKIRKRVALDLKIDEFEVLVNLADEFGEEMSVVMRACFRFGLRHHRQWASKATGISPFTEGDWTPRTPGQLDPTGLLLAPPRQPAFPYQPEFDPQTIPLRPETRTYPMADTVEAVFAPPPPRSLAESRWLPNGATVGGSRDEAPPPSTPFDRWQEQPLQPFEVDGLMQPPLPPFDGTPIPQSAPLDDVALEDLL